MENIPKTVPSPMDNTAMSVMYKSQKTVGLRTFFPDLPSSMSTYEKAKIWVKRHNNNYFIGWTEEQISTLDAIVRPLTIITTQLYKRHMNRSEYGRITKLKFCLESDADWAKEFRKKLMTNSVDGGFKSLGEAKIAATELWRQHSELYDVQRARIGGTHKNVERNRTVSSGDDNTPPKRSRGSSGMSLLSLDRSNNGDDDGSLYETESLVEAADNYPSSEITHHRFQSESDDISYDVKGEGDELYQDDSASTSQNPSFTSQNPSFCIFENSSQPSHSVSHSVNMSVFPDISTMQLPIQEGVDILLQRHRHNFFLDWSSEQLEMVKESVRPFQPVSSDVYHSYIFSEDGQLTSFLGNVHGSREDEHHFMNKLGIPPEDGGYATWNEFIEDLRKMKHHHMKSQTNSPVKEDRRVVLERPTRHTQDFHSDNPTTVSANGNEYTHIKSVLHGRPKEKSKTLSRMSWPPAQNDNNSHLHRLSDQGKTNLHRRSHTDVVVDHELRFKSKRVSPCAHGEKLVVLKALDNNQTSSVPESCLDLTTKRDCSNIFDILWSLRDELANHCAEDPATSWHDKLRPHLPLIRSQLGETYTLPSSTAECIADLTLITIHNAIENNPSKSSD